MPTLSKAKKQTQTVLKWSTISIATILLLFIGIKLITFIVSLIAPPPPPKAAFGKLPHIPFPNQTKENIAYSLDTLTGFLPNFSDRAKVYKITFSPPTLLGLDETRKKVAKIGFSTPGTQISEDTYRWTVNQDKSFQKNITMNIFSSDFIFQSSYLSAESLQTFSGPSEKDHAIDTAKNFLSDMSLFPQDTDEDKTKTTLYSITNNSLTPASKISDTKIVKVDFFQKDLDNLLIYCDKGISSTISLLVGKENRNLEVVDARFFHKNISETSSTYSIKTAEEAFLELQQNQAYIAHKPANTVEFTIKKVFLGYYAGENPQEFMMPIVIFEGSNDFIAYVSAVKDEWINN